MNVETITLINFIDLSEHEKLTVLKWRNDDNVRKWMYNTEYISVEKHFKFIEALQNDENNKYFIVNYDKKNIGVIYFTNINYEDKKTEFGIYAVPSLKGAGNLLMGAIINYAFDMLKVKTLISEVFEDNVSAIKLYKRHDFINIATKQINDRRIICMELKYENR